MASRFERLDKLIDQWDPVIRKSFMTAVYNMRAAAQVDLIIKYIEQGDIGAALRAVNINPLQWRPYENAVRSAFAAGGEATAAAVPLILHEGGFRTIFQFDVRNPFAEMWLNERSGLQITEIVEDQRRVVRQHLSDGMARGVNPRTSALDLVGRIDPLTRRREDGVLGLTSSQAQWMRNYRDELQRGSLDALQRNLRDKRFDGSVRKAAATGEPIPAETVNKMLTAYENRALRYRAETVARTEAMAALHESQQQSIEQAIATGIDPEAVSFTWRATKDTRTRDSHRQMDGQTVGAGEYFVTGDGAQLEYPGDPNGPPEEIINCRCWREPSIDFLAGIE